MYLRALKRCRLKKKFLEQFLYFFFFFLAATDKEIGAASSAHLSAIATPIQGKQNKTCLPADLYFY
jgi:hypothetical protein